jgi:hypothetical protein
VRYKVRRHRLRMLKGAKDDVKAQNRRQPALISRV